MRFVTIIVFIVVGSFVFRYLIRRFKQEMGKKRKRKATNTRTGNMQVQKRNIDRLLGVTANDDPAAIRKKYEELLAKYHPDKVQHLGIEFQEMAETKTKAITEGGYLTYIMRSLPKSGKALRCKGQFWMIIGRVFPTDNFQEGTL